MSTEHVRVLFHQVGEKVSGKLTEIFGYSMSVTGLVISQIAVLEMINGILQTLVLLVSLAGGIATYFYVRKKTKKLDR